MPEVQKHGFDFEQWLRRTFFAPFSSSYTDKWDVPASANTLAKVPEPMRNLPVSIKTCKNRSPIGFGDAIRQFSVTEDFLLIVGFWVQSTPDTKNFVAAEGVHVRVGDWHNLFGKISDKELRELDTTIKSKADYTEVRKQAQAIKTRPPFSTARMRMNPKIDSKNQRRLQCSLPFKEFWALAGKEPTADASKAALFGQPLPNPFMSVPRSFAE